MQGRSFGQAFAAALLSIGLMLGALSISLVEYAPQATFTPTFIPLTLAPFTEVSQATVDVPAFIAATEVPLVTNTPTQTVVLIPTETATAPSHCPIPPGWTLTIVQPNETLDTIAARYRVSAQQLLVANCLLAPNLIAGSALYVPPVPTNTAVACRPGMAGWSPSYIVARGDTFYSIALRYGVKYQTLKAVNCRQKDDIYAGEILWVPIIAATNTLPPTLTPAPGDTLIPYPTDPLTSTPLPFTATTAPSPTPPPPDTPTPYPTLTASPTAFP